MVIPTDVVLEAVDPTDTEVELVTPLKPWLFVDDECNDEWDDKEDRVVDDVLLSAGDVLELALLMSWSHDDEDTVQWVAREVGRGALLLLLPSSRISDYNK